MASPFDSAFSLAAGGLLLTAFGETASYTPKGGSAVEVQARVSAERREPRRRGQDEVLVRVREAQFASDPASQFGGVAAVATNGTFTYGGEVWSIEHVSGPLGGEWSLRIVRDPVVTAGRGDYRGAPIDTGGARR
jgi:hypothetical protein